MEIDVLIQRRLEQFAADKTEKIDWAIESSGGRIMGSSPSHLVKVESSTLLSWLRDCYYPTKNPEEMLSPDMTTGSCWPMEGSRGFAVLRLRSEIRPTEVAIEHISHTIAPDYSTAPNEFEVYGLHKDGGELLPVAGEHKMKGDLLGRFRYAPRAKQLQSFAVGPGPNNRSYQHLKVVVLSNHGSDKYTCLYRVRVHGDAVTDEELAQRAADAAR